MRPEDRIELSSGITIKEIDELLKNSTLAIAQRVSKGTGTKGMTDVIFNEKINLIR